MRIFNITLPRLFLLCLRSTLAWNYEVRLRALGSGKWKKKITWPWVRVCQKPRSGKDVLANKVRQESLISTLCRPLDIFHLSNGCTTKELVKQNLRISWSGTYFPLSDACDVLHRYPKLQEPESSFSLDQRLCNDDYWTLSHSEFDIHSTLRFLEDELNEKGKATLWINWTTLSLKPL